MNLHSQSHSKKMEEIARKECPRKGWDISIIRPFNKDCYRMWITAFLEVRDAEWAYWTNVATFTDILPYPEEDQQINALIEYLKLCEADWEEYKAKLPPEFFLVGVIPEDRYKELKPKPMEPIVPVYVGGEWIEYDAIDDDGHKYRNKRYNGWQLYRLYNLEEEYRKNKKEFERRGL